MCLFHKQLYFECIMVLHASNLFDDLIIWIPHDQVLSLGKRFADGTFFMQLNIFCFNLNQTDPIFSSRPYTFLCALIGIFSGKLQ